MKNINNSTVLPKGLIDAFEKYERKPMDIRFSQVCRKINDSFLKVHNYSIVSAEDYSILLKIIKILCSPENVADNCTKRSYAGAMMRISILIQKYNGGELFAAAKHNSLCTEGKQINMVPSVKEVLANLFYDSRFKNDNIHMHLMSKLTDVEVDHFKTMRTLKGTQVLPTSIYSVKTLEFFDKLFALKGGGGVVK